MGDHHQKSTGAASAQDLACADVSEQNVNDVDEAVEDEDADDGSNRQEERQRLREAHNQKQPLTVERLGQKLLHNKKSTPNYEPVITMEHGWRYTEYLKTAALALANDGLFVFPCRPQDTPDGKKAKEPLVRWKDAATIDPARIEGWWRQHRRPDALIGLRTGMLGGVWVLDVDMKSGTDGITELKKLEAKFGPLPETHTVRTPSGGYHYYFKMPDGITIKNSASKIAPGIDVRAENGYVIAPPSLMGDGRAYVADGNGVLPCEAPFAPPWLIGLVTSDGSKKSSETIASRGWAHRMLSRRCEDVIGA